MTRESARPASRFTPACFNLRALEPRRRTQASPFDDRCISLSRLAGAGSVHDKPTAGSTRASSRRTAPDRAGSSGTGLRRGDRRAPRPEGLPAHVLFPTRASRTGETLRRERQPTEGSRFGLQPCRRFSMRYDERTSPLAAGRRRPVPVPAGRHSPNGAGRRGDRAARQRPPATSSMPSCASMLTSTAVHPGLGVNRPDGSQETFRTATRRTVG